MQESRSRVLFVSQDMIGPRMAGTGIRMWELCRVLSRYCDVTLAALVQGELPATDWRVVPITLNDETEIVPLVAEADVVITSAFAAADYPLLRDLDVPWVGDAYVPSSTECLPLNAHWALDDRLRGHRDDTTALNVFFRYGDFCLCASERQRDLYLGLFAGNGRLNPYTYDTDETLRSLVDVVPYGLSAQAPRPTKPIVRGVMPGVDESAHLIVWGGGIWNWFDPITLVRALSNVLQIRDDVYLYFPGTNHPFEARMPEMRMRAETLALCDELGLTGQHVFVGNWVPYAERQNYLLEADIGISLHQSGIEPRFAYRTRLLDYIWAGLPMVISEGDVLADLVREEGLGYVVAPGDVDGVTNALLALFSEKDARAARAECFQRVAREMTWDRVAEPLVRFCTHPTKAADLAAGYEIDFAPGPQFRQELEEARALNHAYERGRFMRTMAWLKQLGNKSRGRDDA